MSANAGYDVTGNITRTSYTPGQSGADLEVSGSGGDKRLRLDVGSVLQAAYEIKKAGWSVSTLDITGEGREFMVSEIAYEFVRAHKVHAREADLFRQQVEAQKAADAALDAAEGTDEQHTAAIDSDESDSEVKTSREVLGVLLEMWLQKIGVTHTSQLRELVLAAIARMDGKTLADACQHSAVVTDDYFLI